MCEDQNKNCSGWLYFWRICSVPLPWWMSVCYFPVIHAPISTIAIFLTIWGYFSSAWNAAIITLLNTQNPHDDAVVNNPSVPA